MKIKEICQTIEEYAPLNLQAVYDNAGLLCGNSEMEVTSILLSTDITEDVIDEAIENGDNLIISHHPLFIKEIKKITDNNYIGRCLIKAIKNDICIYSAHTNMDSVINGVSGRISDKLNLVNRRILQQTNDNDTGYGIVAELPNEKTTEDFLREIKQTFECECIKYSAICKNNIKRVAVCGGSGASMIQDAIKSGADIYVTGDLKYHDYFLAENRIILVDIGHYESEHFTKDIFYEIVTKKITKFAVRISRINTNPVNYL